MIQDVGKDLELTAAEKAKLDGMGWARDIDVVAVKPGRKLLSMRTPNGDVIYFELTAEPELDLTYIERVHITVTVHEAKEGCNCGHMPGDKWEFSRCTPEGICAEAFHSLYPVIHGLTMGNGAYQGVAADETLVSCPDNGWVRFRIARRLWMPEDWG